MHWDKWCTSEVHSPAPRMASRRVYDTATHTRLGKLERPASVAADPAAPCSLLWRGGRELFVCWGRHVWVLRLVGSLLPAAPGGAPGSAPGQSLQIMASFDAGCAVLGAAPFGADLAVLTWGGPASGGISTDAAGDGLGGAGAAGAATVEGQAGMVLRAGATTSAEEQAAAAKPPAAADAAGAGSVPGTAAEGSSQPPGGINEAALQGQGQLQQTGAEAAAASTAAQQQPLCLSFYSRAGSLLASDVLGSSCAAAERRWYQLALLYPGDADLKLAAAAAPALPASPAPAATPRRTPAGSAAGSTAGSVPSSSRGSPVRVLSGRRGGRDSPGRAADASNGPAGAADGQAAVPDGQGTPPPRQQQVQQGPAPQHAQDSGRGGPAAAAAVQQYKWWRDGEEPLYLVSGPGVSHFSCGLRLHASTCVLCRSLLASSPATADRAAGGWGARGTQGRPAFVCVWGG